MKKLLLTSSLIIAFAAIANAQIPNCPLKVGDVELYSRNSLLGDKICPLLNSTRIIADGLGSSVTNKLNEVKADMDRFKNVTLEGAINTDAVEKYNNAIVQLQSITTDLLAFVKDAECGVPGAIDALKNKFLQSIQTITELSAIVNSFGEALTNLGPVLPQVINIGTKVIEISTSVNNQSTEMKNQFEKLTKAVQEIQKDLEKLLKNDPIKLINTGTVIITGVVPYLGECAACATTLSTSLAGLGTAAAGAGAGTATVETGVGGVAGAVVTAVSLVGSATSTALSSIPCTSVFEKSDQVLKYTQDIEDFLNAISNTSVSISKNAEKIIEASEAINEIGKTLSEENKPKIQAIQLSLKKIANTFSDVAIILENKVVPKIDTFIGIKVQQITKDVLQLQNCFNKLNKTFGYMTNNLKEGILDFVPAITQMVDANQIITNLSNQLTNAKNSAEASLKTNWNSLNQKRRDFSEVLFGNQPTDLGKVAQNFLGLGFKIDELIVTGTNLSSSVINLVTSAANAGKTGFLTSINTNKENAQNTYSSISSKAKALAITIAKEKAKSKASAQARELAYNKTRAINMEAMKPIRKIMPLKNAVQLKSKMIN